MRALVATAAFLGISAYAYRAWAADELTSPPGFALFLCLLAAAAVATSILTFLRHRPRKRGSEVPVPLGITVLACAMIAGTTALAFDITAPNDKVVMIALGIVCAHRVIAASLRMISGERQPSAAWRRWPTAWKVISVAGCLVAIGCVASLMATGEADNYDLFITLAFSADVVEGIGQLCLRDDS